MPSKKRGGLSKRQYAAQKATTQAKKNASVRATASKSVAPLVGAGPLTPGQTRQAPLAGPSLPGKVSPGYYDYSNNSVNLTGYSEPSKKSSSSSSSKKTSTPKATTGIASTIGDLASSAGAALRNVPGLKQIGEYGDDYVNTGNRASLAKVMTPFAVGAAIPAGMFMAGAGGMSSLAGVGRGIIGRGSTNIAKGIRNTASELESGLARTPSLIGPAAALASGGAIIGADIVGRTQETDPTIDEQSVQPDERNYSEEINYSPIRTQSPRQVTTPQFTAPPQGEQFAPSPQITPYSPELDFTPVSQGQPGTTRRFLGNGYLSNGIASNGKLDSEFSGASFGAPTDGMDNIFDEESLRKLLGVQTAQASEMPMASTDMSFSPQTSFSPYASNQGETAQSVANRYQSMFGNPVGQNEQTNNGRIQNPGGSQGGGVAQQFAQGTTGGDPMDNYYNSQLKTQNKGFSAQEKAQKKALNELLKSITSQYKTQQTTGIDQLAKSKQEDLLKLSGLFSFANQDPDSEQRIQYEQRANQDYAGQQGDFLAKLAAAQAQEESRARQGYQTQMSDIAGQRNDARSKIEELIFNARQQAQKGAGTKALSGTAAGSVTYMGDNASGEPVYRNNQTGEMQVGAGLTRKSQDPYAQMMASIMGQQQGGQVQYDENGRPYIEQ